MIVGLVGFIGSGKGTVGEILVETCGFSKASFAGHVKNVAALMFGWNRDLLEGDTEVSRQFREEPDEFWSDKLNKKFTPRMALQLLGTEVGRNIFGENFWIDALEMSIKKNQNYVITDVRFKNEIEWIQKQNGILIEIRRGILPHWYDIAAQANSGQNSAENFMIKSGIHESEWRWIGRDIDHTIENDGTLEDLRKKVLRCLQNSFGEYTMKELLMKPLKENCDETV